MTQVKMKAQHKKIISEVAKSVLRGKFIAPNVYIRNYKRSKASNLSFCLQNLK
jgi:hypothetical protein